MVTRTEAAPSSDDNGDAISPGHGGMHHQRKIGLLGADVTAFGSRMDYYFLSNQQG
jgi:hypothetical protein